MERSDELRGAVIRHLETEALFGARAVPLAYAPLADVPVSVVSRGREADRGRSGVQASRQVSSGARASSGGGVVGADPRRRVQNVTESELQERTQALAVLDNEQVKSCTKCGLSSTRTQTVFGHGNPAARLVFVGEAPGAEEDRQGVPFVGRAGQLLTKMIKAMGLSRDEVFICNILKCRPPDNRDPAPDEIAACWPHLDAQLRLIRPEVIVALGKPSSQTLLRTSEGIGKLRGVWHDYYISGPDASGEPTPLMPTYHPAYLLRSPNEKAKTWSDLKMVLSRLNLPVPRQGK